MRIPEGNIKNKSSKKVIEKIGFSHNIKKEEVQFYGRKNVGEKIEKVSNGFHFYWGWLGGIKWNIFITSAGYMIYSYSYWLVDGFVERIEL